MGSELNHQLEFDKLIEGKSDRDLMEWTARELYYQRIKLDLFCGRLDVVEREHQERMKSAAPCTPSFKQSVPSGAVGGGIVTIVVAAVYALGKALGWIE